MGQLFELKIEASGEVRDAAGNLIEQVPISQTLSLTEEQLTALIDGRAAVVEQGETQ